MASFRKKKIPADIDTILALGDCHIGDLFYDIHAEKRAINLIRKMDTAIVFLMGDMCRYFDYEHKFSSYSEVLESVYPTIVSQERHLDWFMEEIVNDHYVHLIHGNHEASYFKKKGNVYKEKAEDWGVDYVGFQAAVKLCWTGKRELDILATHGKKTISPYPAKPAELRKAFQQIYLNRILTSIDSGASDLYLMGHTHLAIVREPPIVHQLVNIGTCYEQRPVYQSTVNKPTWAINAGSLTKSFVPETTTYPEERMLGPSDLAMIEITLGEDKKPQKIEVIDLG